MTYDWHLGINSNSMHKNYPEKRFIQSIHPINLPFIQFIEPFYPKKSKVKKSCFFGGEGGARARTRTRTQYSDTNSSMRNTKS